MKKGLTLISMVVVLALAAVGCGTNSAVGGSSSSSGEIKIGVQIPLSGSIATDGKNIQMAMNLAAEQINAKGGVDGKKINLEFADDGCDPQMATAAANKLIADGVIAVTGGYCSGAVLPVMSLYNDAKIPMVSSLANSGQLVKSDPGNTFIQNGVSQNQADSAVALFQKIGAKKIALIQEGDAYSADLAALTKDAWTKAGGEVIDEELMNQGETDTSAIVTKIKAANPDVVFWTAYYADGAVLIKNLKANGYKGAIAIGDGSAAPQFLNLAGAAAEGVYGFSQPIAEFLPSAGQFITDFKAKYNTDPGPYASLTYDSIGILTDVFKRAGSDTSFENLIKQLQATSYDGVAGKTEFTEQHTLKTSNFMTVVVKDGKYILAN